MRASGLGIGYFVRVSSIVAVGGTLLGLANSLYVAPRANQAILDMQQALETSQASYEIQPRVFYEDFRNFVLYVQDVRAGTGAANWRQVFMADVTDPATPLITTAASATVVNDSTQELLMRLRDGTRHETVAGQPQQYNISAFATTDLPLALSQQSEVHLGRLDTAIYALPMGALLERTHGPDAKRFLIELHNRFAYPAACLVLMLVGVPLGVASRRGGKSSGFVFTILLVSLYYSSRIPASPWAARTSSPRSSRCGWPTSSSPRPASFCSGKWPAAAAFSTPSPAGSRVLPSPAPMPRPGPMAFPHRPS